MAVQNLNFSSLIDRTNAEVLIPTQYADQIMQDAIEESVVLRMAKRLPNMTSKMLSMPVLNSLPHAYFVNGDTGMKQTSNAAWGNKIITAEEIAVIVPVPDAVLADSQFDIWGQIQPLVRQAFGQVIDNAILFGNDKPASWPEAIIPKAHSAGNDVALTGDGFADIMGQGGLISVVENDGYMVNGYIGSMASRAYLRGITDKNGQPIFRNGMTGGTTYMLDGQRVEFPRNGILPSSIPMLIAGDWDKLVYSIRQDITVTKSNQAVITDSEGKVIYNLYQQDMTALRFVMRLGWQLPNPVKAYDEGITSGGDPYPFAVLSPADE